MFLMNFAFENRIFPNSRSFFVMVSMIFSNFGEPDAFIIIYDVRQLEWIYVD